MKFNQIGFIGLGLIGGSIAIKLKEIHPDANIIATAHSKKTVSDAFSQGLISNESPLELSDFCNCDLIFLCAPVETNIQYLTQLKDIIKEDCIITDVGSTKVKTHEAVTANGLERNFIGGHPMTGSEKNGLAFANPIFLENAYYIVTPAEKVPEKDIEDYIQMVLAFGSIPLKMDYRQHDFATGAVSHLPHMIAFSLTNFISQIDDSNETMKTIAAGSFRDMTRVAASSPEMWESITRSNREVIISLMDQYLDAFRLLRDKLTNYDDNQVLHYFERAKDYRDSLNIPGRKLKTLVHEIYLDLNDEAGQIATIATLLAFQKINIKNIGIVNNREFEEGVLRIEFYDEHAKEDAIRILKERNYFIHEH